MKENRRDGIYKLSVGLFDHTISIFQLGEGLKDPMNLSPFGIYSAAGLTFDILAIIKFSKSRKIKKEIKLRKPHFKWL